VTEERRNDTKHATQGTQCPAPPVTSSRAQRQRIWGAIRKLIQHALAFVSSFVVLLVRRSLLLASFLIRCLPRLYRWLGPWVARHGGGFAFATAMATIVYAFVASYQWIEMKRTRVALIEQNQIAEKSWRDGRRAFLEFEKPDFHGFAVEFRFFDPNEHGPVEARTIVHKVMYQEPRYWTLAVLNRGKIASPNYVIEQSCVRYLDSEPEKVPCPFMPSTFRPMAPDVSESVVPDEPECDPLRLVEIQSGWRNVYIFVVMSYDDGMGGLWKRKGCWFYTVKDDYETVGPVGYHRILPCENLNTPEQRIR